MAVSEYGQVILHNYKLSYLIKFWLFAVLRIFILQIFRSSCFIFIRAAIVLSRYESIISIYCEVKGFSTLMTLVE